MAKPVSRFVIVMSEGCGLNLEEHISLAISQGWQPEDPIEVRLRTKNKGVVSYRDGRAYPFWRPQ